MAGTEPPTTHLKMQDVDDLIEHCFNLGYQQKDVHACVLDLFVHDHKLT